MSANPLPAVTNATVKLDLTFADGTSRSFDFELDTVPNEDHPIEVQISVGIDERDATDYAVDSFRRYMPGDRREIALSISGRGPNASKEK